MNAKHNLAIERILAGEPFVQIAQALNVSERTVRRWMDEPGFRAELETRQARRLQVAAERLLSVAGQAVDVLRGVMDGTITDGANVRRLAAANVLELALKASQAVLFDERLAQVERKLNL